MNMALFFLTFFIVKLYLNLFQQKYICIFPIKPIISRLFSSSPNQKTLLWNYTGMISKKISLLYISSTYNRNCSFEYQNAVNSHNMIMPFNVIQIRVHIFSDRPNSKRTPFCDFTVISQRNCIFGSQYD